MRPPCWASRGALRVTRNFTRTSERPASSRSDRVGECRRDQHSTQPSASNCEQCCTLERWSSWELRTRSAAPSRTNRRTRRECWAGLRSCPRGTCAEFGCARAGSSSSSSGSRRSDMRTAVRLQKERPTVRTEWSGTERAEQYGTNRVEPHRTEQNDRNRDRDGKPVSMLRRIAAVVPVCTRQCLRSESNRSLR